ncbi:DUF2332 family protein [Frigoribacterium salinisoli]
MTTADRFSAYADAADRDGTPEQAALARGIAGDPELVAVVDRAQESRRQPVLVLAVARWLGLPRGPWSVVRPWLLDHADLLVAELGRRLTQTNDVRRCGPLSFGLARVPGPVSLLEVGASAGLALVLDRYGYRAGGSAWGDPASPVQLDLELSGPGAPGDGARGGAASAAGSLRLPEVVRRTGVDLAPVDPTSDDEVRWLDALLPAEAAGRRDLLARAVRVARGAPPALVAGDAVAALDDQRLTTPAPGSTLVVVTTGVLVYLPGERRQAFTEAVTGLDARWLSYERTGSLHAVPVPEGVDPADPAAFATLALDGVPLAVGDAHGTRLRLLP